MFQSSNKPKVSQSVLLIPQGMIVPSPYQPRREFNYEDLVGLSESIRENGILQPLTVRKTGNLTYELIAGERRLRAARLAGLTMIPCLNIDVDEKKAAMLTLLENLQRADLSFFEESDGIAQLIDQWGITQVEAAHKLGKAQSTIANKLRLLRLSSQQRERIINAKLSERHARALLRLQDEVGRENVLDEIIAKNLNVAETDRLIDKLLLPPLTVTPSGVKRMPFVRDVRLFVNTISKAVDTMRQSGLDAKSTKTENDEYIEYLVKIPKQQSKTLARHAMS